MKKLIAALFSLMLILALPVQAFAAEEKLTLPSEKDHLPYYYTLLSKDEQADYLKLRKAVINHDKRIEFTASEVTESFLRKAQRIMLEYDSYTFDIDEISTMSSGYETNGKYRASKYELTFKYLMSKENYMRAVAYADKKVQKFLAEIPEDMSSTQKLLAAHDFIIEECVYDLEYENGYTAYAAIVYGRALCEGYAKAFQYICEEFGIPCVIAVGMSPNSDNGHAWNKVKVGKNWYNIDVTNDDTDDNFYGYISKNYFFLADSEYSLANEIFYDELEEPVASDTEHSYYEMTGQSFATADEAITYMKGKLQKDLPVTVVVALGSNIEYNKFALKYFDEACTTPAVKKYREVHSYIVNYDKTLTYMIHFYS
ncbi:MAG: hypothetical protein LBL98_00255 [Ruminococcus sp.]|jgi:hypothetical protein|nr:hypothetical protein [Ruminococcus sp.]